MNGSGGLQRTLCRGSGQPAIRWRTRREGTTPVCPTCDQPVSLADGKIEPHPEPWRHLRQPPPKPPEEGES